MARRFLAGIVLTLTLAAGAQQAKNEAPAPAPVPEQIAKAKTVFVSNAGADGAAKYSGGEDRPYNQFYAAMKSWGRYELTPAPAGSDLIFELVYIEPITFSGDVQVSYPQLRLTILDPSTHAVLWAFTVHVRQAARQVTGDKNLDDAMATLVGDVKELVARSSPAPRP
jgi:hypothetical protein